MNELSKLLSLTEAEKSARGLLFTPREIAQQPETWASTRRTFEMHSKEIADFLRAAGAQRDPAARPAILLIGAGTSDYIGKALAPLFKRKWRSPAEAVPSTDLLTEMDDLIAAEENYLWISFSRSGDSSEGVAVIRAALEKYQNVYHFIVTCNRHGAMARDFAGEQRVYCLTLPEEVNDRGLAMTSSFSNMVVAGQCLAHVGDENADYTGVFEALGRAGEKLLRSTAVDTAADLARANFSKICFLGTGALRAVAIESALKVLELTGGKIHTFSESYLGLRHGPLSAIDRETLVVGFLSADARRRSYEADLLEDIRRKSLAGEILTVAPHFADARAVGENTVTIDVPPYIPDVYRVPVDVIFGQLFGLFASLENGLKPDTPSPTGAISRVVESVTVY
ncbi:MAG TPA: SIS domain-containing protein [Pyrinomonadaceae bacterium]|jgi:tagatose-6-phosphate ketose/aldose isomerase